MSASMTFSDAVILNIQNKRKRSFNSRENEYKMKQNHTTSESLCNLWAPIAIKMLAVRKLSANFYK